MMREEFQKIAGYEVSNEDYINIIEPMYMATNLSKEDFVKVIDRKRFDIGAEKKRLLKKMKMIAKHLKDTCTHYTDLEAEEELKATARKYIQLKYKDYATFGIHEEMLWSCYYPKSIEIFGITSYQTIESIELI